MVSLEAFLPDKLILHVKEPNSLVEGVQEVQENELLDV